MNHILSQLPEDKLSGSIFIDSSDFVSYRNWFVGWTLAFFFILQAWDLFFRAIGYQHYLKMETYERLVFRQLYASNSHHVIVTALVLYSYMAVSSECQKPSNFIWFTDEVCFQTVDRQFVKNVMVTLGYLAYDFILLTFFFKKDKPITRQTLYHHVFGTICLFCAVKTGYAMVGIANASLLCEISTFFLNYRSQYKPEELNNSFPLLNQVVFLITFIFTRIFGLPYLFYLEIIMLNQFWPILDTVRRITGLTCALMCIFMILINLYWFKLILKGLHKLLIHKGILQSSDKYQRVEEKEK